MSKSLHYSVAAAVVALALAGCNRDAEQVDTSATSAPPAATAPAPLPQTPPPAAVSDEVQTAVNVSSVILGTEAGADRSIPNPVNRFGSDDPIVVSIVTDGAASNVEVGARLVYQDGQVAGTQSQALNTTGRETTNITFNNANGWPAGNYTAEVTVNGTQAHSATFVVQ